MQQGDRASFILEIAGQGQQKAVWKKLAAVSIILMLCIAFVNPVIGSVNEVRHFQSYAVNPDGNKHFCTLKTIPTPMPCLSTGGTMVIH
ncbi:hypothetical protein CW713_12240 [Methanophagales archaeon]|nr:MAG: hypothetical protein CW713_12240 [Methanophagales archaeon]